MEVIPDEEEVAIDAIPLAVNSLKIMLRSFDREDLEDLYKLVKAKYESTRPVEDLDLLLWGDLKTMFEPHVEDKGRIVGIKSLLYVVGINAAQVCANTAQLKLVMLVNFKENMLSGYYCQHRSDALSRKERVKSRRVRGMILAAQSEAFKQENVLAERLHGLDQQMERKGDESLYFMDQLWVAKVGKYEEVFGGCNACAIGLDQGRSQTLRFVEESVEIVDREIRKLKRRKIALVKVIWNSKRGPEFNWKHEDQMRIKYPWLFVD
ncbi:hypothetical protein Tco_0625004 [Tanacetum coccineum]|uniref:Reverse transcriptase domain-containing protein n=1 Tax=Tanacetum coccineum TaxID=301880 RepID=A0ABQ4WFM3_9ASTR